MHSTCCRLLLTAALAFSTAAAAWEHKRDQSGEPVQWRTPVVLVMDESLDRQLAPGASDAVEAATRTLAAELATIAVSTRPGTGGTVGFDFAEGAVNRNEIVALDTWNGHRDAVAMTVLTVDQRTHAIVDADIAFDSSRRWAVTNPGHPDADRYDVQNALTHELGHLAGLAHTQDPEATMFPSTCPAETKKRTFDDDDRAGLAALYPKPADEPTPEAGAPSVGCSTTSGSTMTLATLGLLALLRRRRAAAVLAALLPVLAAQASEPAVVQTGLAMVGRVTSVKTLPPEAGVTVLQTEIWVQVAECFNGQCPATVRVLVPGGTWGNYTQTVGGLELPVVGALVGLSRERGADPWLRLEALRDDSARARFVSQRVQVARARNQ